jgi:hypothetical protein
MKQKYVAWIALLAGLSGCTQAVPLVGLWEAKNCHSVETTSAGRRVFARTDLYPAGQVVCEFTSTEVLHYSGGQVQVRARYTRTPTGFQLEQGQGLGAVTLSGNSTQVTIAELTPTRLVIRQMIPSSDTTILTSTIAYARVAPLKRPGR